MAAEYEDDMVAWSCSASTACPVAAAEEEDAPGPTLMPGVLMFDLWCLGEDGALPTVLRVWNKGINFISSMFTGRTAVRRPTFRSDSERKRRSINDLGNWSSMMFPVEDECACWA